MEKRTQFMPIVASPESLDSVDLAIPNRTISVREAAFKLGNGIPVDAYLRQPTDIPMSYDRFDILDRGAAYRRDLIMNQVPAGSPGDPVADTVSSTDPVPADPLVNKD